MRHTALWDAPDAERLIDELRTALVAARADLNALDDLADQLRAAATITLGRGLPDGNGELLRSAAAQLAAWQTQAKRERVQRAIGRALAEARSSVDGQ